jgi:hypothetical protein
LLGLLHLPLNGEDLFLRTLRPALDRAYQETDKSPHLLDNTRRFIPGDRK